MVRYVALAIAVLPALSTAVATTVVTEPFAPRTVLRVIGQRARPDSASFAAHRTFGAAAPYTVPLLIPTMCTVGLLRSMLMPRTVTVAMPPSTEVMVRVTTCAAPLCASSTGSGHGPKTADPSAVQTNRTVTGVRYQPSRDFALPELTTATIRGLCPVVEADEPVKSLSPE